MKNIYLLFLFSLTGISSLYAEYTITPFSNPNFCSTYPSAYTSKSFSITETVITGVKGFTKGQTNTTLVLGFSNASFQFNPGTGTVTASGTEVTIISYSITATSITVNITTSGSNTELNTIDFNNVQVLAMAAATGFITRTGGTFKIDNLLTAPSSTVSWGDLTAQTALTYSASTAIQPLTTPVFAGTDDNQIIGVQVAVGGTCSALTATSFNFNTTGSTAPRVDISNAKVYYTGTTNSFSTATQFGTTFSNPNGAFTISGSQALNLGAGTYYFWLSYSISNQAIAAHVVDAQLVSSVVSENTFTPSSGNPAGTRAISTNSFYSIAAGNWSSTSIWSNTPNGVSCACAPTTGTGYVYINHAVAVNNSYASDNVIVQNSGSLTNAAGKILTVTNTLSTSGNGSFSASTPWVLNNVSTSGPGTSSSSSAITLTGSLITGNASTFQMTGGATLTINGNITTNGTLDLGTSNLTNSNAAGTLLNGTGNITGSGTITLGVNKVIPINSNLTIGPAISISNNITITNNAVVNMQNNVIGGGINSKWVNAVNSVLNMGGTTSALLATGLLDVSAVPNTVNYNGSGNQTIKTPTTGYYNLYASSTATGVKYIAAALTVNNDIKILSGAQLNAGANIITLNGNWINNSTNATPFSSTGTVKFNGTNNIVSGTGITSFNHVNITATGLLTSHGITGKVIVLGNWINDGDFDNNFSDIIFNGTTLLSGTAVTEFNTIIVNSSKTLTLHATETDFDADVTINGTLNHNSGLVGFTGTGNTQNINGSVGTLTLFNVEISNPSGNVLLRMPLTINNALTLTDGNIVLGSNNLILGSSVPAIKGSPFTAGNMIVASSTGAVVKSGTTAASASYMFPVGDNTGAAEYSPITITFHTGTYTSGSASVKVVNAKHPDNTNVANYLNRYWTVSTTGYVVTGSTVAASYVDEDIAGTEANVLMGKWNGSRPWVRYTSSVNPTTNTFTSLSVTSFGDFTGINSTNPALSISFSEGSATVCQNLPVTLTALSTGDPALTYLWNNGSATQAISPSTAVAGVYNYTVTVTDGNGFASNAVQSLTVNAFSSVAGITGTTSACVSTTTTLSNTSPGGTWSSSNTAVATVNNSTGVVTGISAGTTTITYSVSNGSGCTSTASTAVNINATPFATINYPLSPYCISAGTATVTKTGTGGGTFSSTQGLTINSGSGDITLASSTPGSYVVTYTMVSGGCTIAVTSPVINITVAGTWSGSVSNDWNSSGNWLCNSIPSTTTNVIIPGNSTRYPVISSGINSANNITIQNGASLTVSGGTLQIAGNIINSGTFNSTHGTIALNGTSAQAIPAATFAGNNVFELDVNNTAGVTLQGPLSIVDILRISAGSLTTGGYLTLKSSAANTARLSEITSLSPTPIIGNVTVERYIQGRRKYRLATSSVTTSASSTLSAGQESLSMWGNWQNQGNNTTPNVGTILTGGASADGFDTQTTSASLFTYNSITRKFVAYTSTNAKNTKYTPLKAGLPFYMFVYGDRLNSITTSAPNNTVLKATGTLLTGNQVYTTTSAMPLSNVAGEYTLLGNPYASIIDWKSVQSINISKTIWGWDANLSSTGGYVTVTSTLTGALISPVSDKIRLTQYIQPGQAFFVKTTAPSPQILIKESDKVDDELNISSGIFRTTGANTTPLLAVNLLYTSAGTSVLADGVIAAFDRSFTNKVTDEDGIKMINSYEGIALSVGNDLLSINARQMPQNNDTLFINTSKLTKPQYTLEIFANDMVAGSTLPYLEDAYLRTSRLLSLSDTNRIVFTTITSDSASFSANRFRITFRQSGLLPLTFTAVNAIKKGDMIQVTWDVAEQTGIQQYEVNRSSDGVYFTKVGNATAISNSTRQTYSWLDVNPLPGSNYYRIRAIEADGTYSFSKVAIVITTESSSGINVFPNPVTNFLMNLELIALEKGRYMLSLYNAKGQKVMEKPVDHEGGTTNQKVPLDTDLPPGTYYLKVQSQRVNHRKSIVIVK